MKVEDIWAKSDGTPLYTHLNHALEWARLVNANEISALFHDLGKVNPHFQKMLKSPVADTFPRLSIFKKNPRHEILSVAYLSYLTLAYDLQLDYDEISKEILWHHKNPLSNPQLYQYELYNETFVPKPEEFYKNYFNLNEYDVEQSLQILFHYIKEELEPILIEVLKKAGFEISGNKKDVSFEEWVDLFEKGLTIMGSTYVYKDKFIISKEKLNVLRKAGLLKRADYSASSFKENYGIAKIPYLNHDLLVKAEIPSHIKERAWQYETINNVSKDKEVYILEAPTGSGKTAFAYLLSKHLGKKKLLYVLPYRAALNEKYEKLLKNGIEVGLLHSTSILQFEKTTKENDPKDESTKEELSQLFHYTFLLSTAHQTLITSLEFYGSDYYMGLYDKDMLIVLDEPQAFNPPQQAIILRSIEIALYSGATVLIMSATFPASLKNKLKTLGFNVEEINVPSEIKNYKNKRHFVKLNEVKENNDLEDAIVKKIKEVSGKKVLVVINSVSKARDIYQKLKDMFKDYGNVYLMHSRLGWQQKENVLNQLKDKKEWILVSTQVVEAAVDIDADILITTLSPMPSQVQRWGRVYRNRNLEYEGSENIHIFYKSKGKGKNKTIEAFHKNIYDTKSLEITLEILNDKTKEILNYEKEKEMIEKYYKKLPQDELDDYYNDLPLYTTDIETKKEAEYVFAPDDFTFSAIIKEELLELLENGKNVTSLDLVDEPKVNYLKIPEIFPEEFSGKYIHKKHLIKLSHNVPKKYADLEIARIGSYSIISIRDYDEKKKDINELGLEAVLDNDKSETTGIIL